MATLRNYRNNEDKKKVYICLNNNQVFYSREDAIKWCRFKLGTVEFH